jgi:tRNA A37 threonylcarbamoyladenosine dehydratase
MKKLKHAKVAVFGLGGVGGYVAEALARSGIGALDLVDHDTISLTNINRQILATRATVGMDKAEAAAQRVKAINPECDAKAIKTFYLPETAHQFDFTKYNYVVDAIDTVTGKLMLVQAAKDAGTPIISSMGTGNKLDPTAFEVTDINKTTFCPLARIMRKELKKRGIPHLKVVYSQEPAMTPGADSDEPVELSGRKPVPGSTAFVPAVAGLILAGEVIKDLTGVRNE